MHTATACVVVCVQVQSADQKEKKNPNKQLLCRALSPALSLALSSTVLNSAQNTFAGFGFVLFSFLQLSALT